MLILRSIYALNGTLEKDSLALKPSLTTASHRVSPRLTTASCYPLSLSPPTKQQTNIC